MIASMNGHYEVVQRLVTKHGALMNLEDSEGKTAREHAIEALE
jgi:ankyrin repeat protein